MKYKSAASKRVQKACSIFTFFILLFKCTPVFTLEEENTGFSGNFVIRQERYETDGVWVSRPVPLDEKIRNIIYNNNIKSLEDYEQWLGGNIKYKRDDEDIWSPPEETLQKKYGDCEDFAFLNAAVLRVLGYQPKVLAMGGRGRNHAICVFKQNGRYLWFDNTKLARTQASSLLEFAKYIFINYNYPRLLEIH